ncbi:hypothetical protein RA210_U40303 [Rubrivivax sp. A210]|nr:hypothetical protein RA210_U40303 [Rubrivivax sp. A210]
MRRSPVRFRPPAPENSSKNKGLASARPFVFWGRVTASQSGCLGKTCCRSSHTLGGNDPLEACVTERGLDPEPARPARLTGSRHETQDSSGPWRPHHCPGAAAGGKSTGASRQAGNAGCLHLLPQGPGRRDTGLL